MHRYSKLCFPGQTLVHVSYRKKNCIRPEPPIPVKSLPPLRCMARGGCGVCLTQRALADHRLLHRCWLLLLAPSVPGLGLLRLHLHQAAKHSLARLLSCSDTKMSKTFDPLNQSGMVDVVLYLLSPGLGRIMHACCCLHVMMLCAQRTIYACRRSPLQNTDMLLLLFRPSLFLCACAFFPGLVVKVMQISLNECAARDETCRD